MAIVLFVVFAFCIKNAFSEENEELEQTKEVTFLQYNLHLFGGTAELTVLYHDEERRIEVCEHILAFNPDVVSLVEIWSKEYKHLMAACLSKVYPYYHMHETPAYEIGNGLLILSKFPINNTITQFVEYKHLSGWDYFSQKGILGTVVTIPDIDKSFRLFTTHNQAAYTTNLYAKERTDNIHHSSEFITQFHNDEEKYKPAIYVGDLNLGLKKDYQQEYIDFSKLFETNNNMVDSFGSNPICMIATVDPPNNNMAEKFDGKKYPPERDDFLMMTSEHWETVEYGVIKDWKCVDGKSDCSDHYPIYSKLSFKY